MKSSLIIVKFFESRDALRMKSAVAKAEKVVKRRRRVLHTDWKRSLWRKKARHMELEGSINFFLVFFHMFSPCFYYYLTCPWREPDAPTFFFLFFEVDLCGLYIRLFFLLISLLSHPYDSFFCHAFIII